MAAVPPGMVLPRTPNPRLAYTKADSVTGIPAVSCRIYGRWFVPQEVEIVRTWTGVADTATITVPRTDDVDWSTLLKNPTSDEGAVIGEIWCGFPTTAPKDPSDVSQLKRRFYGIVSPDYEMDGDTDTVTFQLASIAVLLQLAKQTKVSLNQTTTDYIKSVAALVPGLTADVRLGSQKPLAMRAVFAREYSVGTHNLKPWELAESCAELEDATLRVDQTTLLYVASDAYAPGKTLSYVFGRDLMGWKGRHAPQYNANIEVEVRTWAPKVSYSYSTRATRGTDGTVVTKSQGRTTVTIPQFGTLTATTVTTSANSVTTSTRTNSGGLFNTGFSTIPRDSSKERYIYKIPGLTRDEADQIRDQIYRRLSRFEYACTFEVPVTAANFDALGDMETVFELSNLPQAAFNTGGAFPVYHQRRSTEHWAMPQGQGSTDGGVTVMPECVNHLPPTGGGQGL